MTPLSPQLAWLFESARKYHLEACKFMLKYFRTTLSSPVISYLSGLDPTAQSNILTPTKLNHLAREYSKVVDSIQYVGGMDTIKEEIIKYVTDEDVKQLPKEDYESFWLNVKELNEGQSSWRRYDVLPHFALCMATRYDANAEVERSFSLMNLVHQNAQRNSMSQATLDSHLHIRSKVESKESKDGCDKCQSGVDHCHCCRLVITEDLRLKCKQAWRALREVTTEVRIEKESKGEKEQEIREKAEKKEKERIVKLKENIAKRSSFCNELHFEPIYLDKKPKNVQKSKDGNGNDPSLSSKNNNKRPGSSNSSLFQSSSKKKK